jgi:hypothetical protein
MLYHYFDKSTGPFINLSELTLNEAEKVMNDIRKTKRGFASKRSTDYIKIRRELEEKAREIFILKGGRPKRSVPHYMTLGECEWLKSWYENGKHIKIPLKEFDYKTISFTYGDLFPTMRDKDGKSYRGEIYLVEEIANIISEYGFPHEWNKDGKLAPERYIEVQVWDDDILKQYEYI